MSMSLPHQQSKLKEHLVDLQKKKAEILMTISAVAAENAAAGEQRIIPVSAAVDIGATPIATIASVPITVQSHSAHETIFTPSAPQKNPPGSQQGEATDSGLFEQPTPERDPSLNALKHGFAAGRNGVENGAAQQCLEEECADLMAKFLKDLRPETDFAAMAVRRMVFATAQLEALEKSIYNRTLFDAKLAATKVWDEQRSLKAERVSLRLDARPIATVRELKSTKQGTELLVHFWEALRSVVVKHGTLTDEQRLRGLNLLGCDPTYREGTHPFFDKVTGPKRKAFLLRQINGQIAELRERISSFLTDLDSLERSHECDRAGTMNSLELRRLFRYRREALKRYADALEDYKRLQPDGSERHETLRESLGDTKEEVDTTKTCHETNVTSNRIPSEVVMEKEWRLPEPRREHDWSLLPEYFMEDQNDLRCAFDLDQMEEPNHVLAFIRLESFSEIWPSSVAWPVPDQAKPKYISRDYLVALLSSQSDQWNAHERELAHFFCPILTEDPQE